MTIKWPANSSKLTLQQSMLLSTIRLEVAKPTGLHVGTGVFLRLAFEENRSLVAIVTNKHVLRNGSNVFGQFRRQVGDEFIIDDGLRVELAPPIAVFLDHPSADVDLTAIIIPPLHKLKLPDGAQPGAITLQDEMFAAEKAAAFEIGQNVTMIGYPIGLYDKVHNLPIARRGALATPFLIDFNGRPEFVVDIGAFRGSSGSPVFSMDIGSWSENGQLFAGNRVIWLGILWGGQVLKRGKPVEPSPVPTAVDELDNDDIFPLNLGHCVKASEIISAKASWLETLKQMQLV